MLEPEIKSGNSIVFMWKKKSNIENATYHNIEEDMNTIFEKSNLKNKEI